MRVRSTTLLLTLGALGGASALRAQDPVTLPQVTVKGQAGARFLSGFVKDTMGTPLADATVTIGKLHLLVHTRVDGSFRFDSVPAGKFEVRARKLGYAPQILEVKIEKDGGRMDDFALVPAPRALPAVVSAVARLGLSGVVADTSFTQLPGAEVKVLGQDMTAVTDSMGAFYIPLVRTGTYMVSVSKLEFKERIFSVSMPSDSGRRVTISLQPGGPPTKLTAWNTADLAGRLAWSKPSEMSLYTRERLDKLGIVWAYDAVVGGAIQAGRIGDLPDPNCYALVDGGPGMVKIGNLSTEELESIEVYGGGGRQTIGLGGAARPASNGLVKIGKMGVASTGIAPPPSDFLIMERLARANFGKGCPLVYVWSR
jgi:hypothetical protein